MQCLKRAVLEKYWFFYSRNVKKRPRTEMNFLKLRCIAIFNTIIAATLSLLTWPWVLLESLNGLAIRSFRCVAI